MNSMIDLIAVGVIVAVALVFVVSRAIAAVGGKERSCCSSGGSGSSHACSSCPGCSSHAK